MSHSFPSSNEPGTSDPRVVLEPIAKEQAAVLQNLVELYAYDFSEHVPLDLKPSGLFEISS